MYTKNTITMTYAMPNNRPLAEIFGDGSRKTNLVEEEERDAKEVQLAA